MKAMYLQRGETLDYKNTTDATIPAGSVVAIKTHIGVAGTDILPGATGSLHVSGVFTMAKADGKEVVMGDALYMDTESDNLTTEAEGNVPAGYAAADAASTDPTVQVNISDPPASTAVSSYATAGTHVQMNADDKAPTDPNAAAGGK